MDSRQQHITKHLNLSGCGLEIAPLFRPTVPKHGYNVYYTDYAPTEVLREKNANNPSAHSGQYAGIQTLDFVWLPGSNLKASVPNELVFDYAVASHVIEHVPNIVGWLNEILAVIKPGGKLALVIPNKTACFDYYRQTTPVAEFVDAWIRQASKPSPKQIFDCLSMAADDSGPAGSRPFDLHLPVHEAKRVYSLDEAYNYAVNSYYSDEYLDVHCSVFTPESFVDVISTLIDLGLINVTMTTPEQGEPSVEGGDVSGEFMVTLTKVADPVKQGRLEAATTRTEKLSDLEHARQAFRDAIAVQEKLKSQIRCLERGLYPLVLAKRIVRKIMSKLGLLESATKP
ncbi:class I SAM-dependent methyltransferase [Pseudomonas sp. K2I15]|uniref:class I SAM-dependent methyltransferase n=1 Tax=unclassified Pseudomonas TaxID=196821 RepID=UPI000B4CF8ED|nr:class I SAM-dependent methyltransferase [Pseudomonas sp. K2I15]OWP69556.1 hypothetical protein CEC48_22180 [Pseudomonas sp. K2I15]